MNKLSMNTVAEIREAFRSGKPIKDIAVQYEISEVMASAIVNNVIYKETIPTRF